jgi:hypothetical protein
MRLTSRGIGGQSAGVMGELFPEIMMKVYREHPELVPDGLK